MESLRRNGASGWTKERERERERDGGEGERGVDVGFAGLWDCGEGGWVAACAACVLLGISQCASITVHQM